MEYLGLHFGTVFGGQYVYRPGQLSIAGVPVSVIAFWAVFIYTGYCITTSFLYWRKKNKPSKKTGVLALVGLVLLDAWFVTAIDLFMDPIQVTLGGWKWLQPGLYFGVPFGNFVGWFVTTLIVTGLFRSLEYFYPTKPVSINRSVYLIPVLGYGAMALSLSVSAAQQGLFTLLPIGLLFMIPTVIWNIILFRRLQ